MRSVLWIVCVLVIASLVTCDEGTRIGGTTDEHGCLGSAGFRWCQHEKACVRSWELATAKNIENTDEAFEEYCSSTPPTIGGQVDDHGCASGGGYTWCEREQTCVRSWELATAKNIENTDEAFEEYCSSTPPMIGGARDEHGCARSGGYTWCEHEQACVRGWELINAKHLADSPDAVQAYCSQPRTTVGGGRDDHGCITPTVWCASVEKCARPAELVHEQNLDENDIQQSFTAFCSQRPTEKPIGGDRDAHSCTLGYQWCQRENRCVRGWELAAQHKFPYDPRSVDAYCAGSPAVIGGKHDEHQCLSAAGYEYCAFAKKCVRPWELAQENGFENTQANVEGYCEFGLHATVGGDVDKHGCDRSAGQLYCEATDSCVRPSAQAQENGEENTLANFHKHCDMRKIVVYVDDTSIVGSSATGLTPSLLVVGLIAVVALVL